jgi:hypothetical protein
LKLDENWVDYSPNHHFIKTVMLIWFFLLQTRWSSRMRKRKKDRIRSWSSLRCVPILLLLLLDEMHPTNLCDSTLILVTVFLYLRICHNMFTLKSLSVCVWIHSFLVYQWMPVLLYFDKISIWCVR